MQKAILAIEAEQERADDRFALVVTETADHAVRAAIVLHFLHSAALARAIVEIATLGDDAVEHGSDVLEPPLCLAQIGRGRRQSNSRRGFSDIDGRNLRACGGALAAADASAAGHRHQQADRRELEARAFLPPASTP